jgi:uncharacterized protein (TIGR03083 family)
MTNSSARPHLGVPRHLEGLREAMVAFVRYADRAGLRAPVPTTPDWSVRRLVAHQGMVHRWAVATIHGLPADPDALEQEGIDAADPLDWLGDGAIDLVTALVRAPDDLSAPVFLHDAPAPREFWARRQCHETTIHSVDALAAALGRYPTSADTGIDPAVAVDGIDELLAGFMTRNKSRLRSESPLVVGVVAAESPTGWLVEVGPAPAVVTVASRDEVADRCDVRLEGPAVAVYLTLWNRSDELDLVDLWRSAPVTWG